MVINRRQFGATLGASLTLPRSMFAATKIESVVRGVQLGVQTYSFHSIQVGGPDAVDRIIAAMTRIGLGMCEVFAQDLSPFPLPAFAYKAWAAQSGVSPDAKTPSALDTAERSGGSFQEEREKLRQWRLNTPNSYFAELGRRFTDAGIAVFAYNYSFDKSMTDAEIDMGFEHAHALGTDIITASSTLTMARRLVPFVDKHRMTVSFHGHSNLKDPDQFATPQSFATALAMSPHFKINLDIGHFAAAGFDPVAYINQQHANITNLHIKDRKKNDGANEPLGQGDTPVREVLLLLRDKHYRIPAFIEYEYVGSESPEREVAKSFAYEKQILNS